MDSFQHNEEWKRPAGAATSLAFGGKSRYLCIGDKSGAVCLWDLKKKVRVRQFFHEGQPSLQVSLDPKDTYVLSLTSQALRSYKLREGVPATTWTPASDYFYTKYNTSTLEPNIAVVGTDDGSLLLYDITNLQKSVPFFTLSRRHNGSITGVAFSSTNDKLLASTSTDGSLQFFDKGSGSLIEEIGRLQSGISSLSLNIDGISCAVGTKSGQVLIYDLRRPGSTLANIHIRGAVTSLRFSPPPKQRNAGNDNSAPPLTLTKVPQSSPDRKIMDDLRRDLDRATDPDASSQLRVASIKHVGQPQQSGTFTAPQHHVNEHPSLASVDQQTSYVGPIGSKEVPGNPTSAHRGLPLKSLAQKDNSPDGARVDSFSSQKIVPHGHPSKLSSGNVPLSSNNPPHPSHEEVVDASGISKSQLPTTSSWKIEDIRDVVRDEVEKLQDDLEESLRNLHMDMIRQFHQQSQELNSALSSQLAAMDQLREENQRLREENDFLKRHQKQNQSIEQRKHQGDGMTFGS